MPIFTVGCAAVCAKIYEAVNIKKEAAADAPATARRGAAEDEEQTIAEAAATVTNDEEARARRAEVPANARDPRTKNTGNAQTVPKSSAPYGAII